MKRRQLPIYLTTLFMLSLATNAAAQAKPLNGHWVYVGGDTEEKKRLQAIEAGTTEMSVFTRGTARERLSKQTSPALRLKLVAAEERIELKSKEGEALTLYLGAKPIEVSSGGEKSKLSAREISGKLQVVAKGENGRRTSTYTVSPNGERLTVLIRMESDKLSKPIEYELTYKREAN